MRSDANRDSCRGREVLINGRSATVRSAANYTHKKAANLASDKNVAEEEGVFSVNHVIKV